MTPKSEFLAGALAVAPLLVGVAPFGIIFGALALTSGLSMPATLAMSAFVFAGSAQFIAATLVGAGATVWLIIATTFVVNLRHLLYSVTVAPHIRHLPTRWQAALAFWLTDEAFAVVMQRYNKTDQSPHKHWFFLGIEITMYIVWQLSTIIGVLLGQRIDDPLSWGLDFALPVTFIGILIPTIKDKATLAAVISASIAALVAYSLPNQLGLMVASVVGIGIGVSIERLTKTTRTAGRRQDNSQSERLSE
ncbi:MAG: AzlC family ABC transporter permease [Chloroflexota bacterium]